jgi:hypothetical protein
VFRFKRLEGTGEDSLAIEACLVFEAARDSAAGEEPRLLRRISRGLEEGDDIGIVVSRDQMLVAICVDDRSSKEDKRRYKNKEAIQAM